MLREIGSPFWVVLECQYVHDALADLCSQLVVTVLEVLKQRLDEVVMQLGHMKQLESLTEFFKEVCMLPPEPYLIMYVLVECKQLGHQFLVDYL